MPHGRIYSAGVPVSGGGASSQVLFGFGAPGAGLGNLGDAYFDKTAKAIYSKTGVGVWTLETNYFDAASIISEEIIFDWNAVASSAIFNLPATSLVLEVDVIIEDQFDAVGPTCEIGTLASPSKYLAAADSNLNAVAGTRVSIAKGNIENVADEALLLSFTAGAGGTVGRAHAVVYYSLPNTRTAAHVPPPPPPAFGYWVIPTPIRGTSTLDFSNDAVNMVQKGGLVLFRNNLVGCNSATFGYACGHVDNVDRELQKLDFANDVAFMAAAALTPTPLAWAVAVNSALFGYFAGGEVPPTFAVTNAVSKLDFANDLVACVAVANLITGRETAAGMNSALFGYFSGGSDAAFVRLTSTDRIDFANDLAAMVASGALGVTTSLITGYNSATFGYASGGTTAAGVITDATWALDFANDAAALVAKGVMTAVRQAPVANNSTLFGYVAGGANPGGVNVTDALDFANDVAAMVAKGVLTFPGADYAGFQSGGIL